MLESYAEDAVLDPSPMFTDVTVVRGQLLPDVDAAVSAARSCQSEVA
jgi:hypothetical protein